MAFDGRYFTKFMRSEIFVAVKFHIKFVWFLKCNSVITDTLKSAGFRSAGDTV